MAQKFVKGTLQRRFYGAAVSAPKPAAKPVTPAEVQVSRAGNGVRLATQEAHSSLARVVCAVKAGSRYEDPSQRGVSHCLRIATDLTQREARSFYLTSSLQQMAANVSCTSSREHLIYTLEVPKSCVNDALPFFTGIVASQTFRPWEISDVLPRMEYEIGALSEQPDKRVVESAHYAAYRESGLGRSIYAPLFQLSEFSRDMLREYVSKFYTPDRVSMSASGVDMADLVAASDKMNLQAPAASHTDSKSSYSGGESRENSEDLLAYTVLAGEGASVGDELWAFAVLEQLLGAGPQIRWASNTTNNKLNSALQKKTQEPFHAQAFNVNYSDSGLFGISAVTVPENSDVVIRTVLEQLHDLASKPVDSQALQGAKNRVKTSVAFQAECTGDAVQSRALELLQSGDVSPLSQITSLVDSVSAATVQKAAQKVVNSKLTMASIGEIYNVPYIDQLHK